MQAGPVPPERGNSLGVTYIAGRIDGVRTEDQSMGWERGQYYTRSRKVNGRVVREYVGGGMAGALAAELDALDREQRDPDREAMQVLQEKWTASDAALDELDASADRLAHAALLIAGYRRHKRGEWRKKRGCHGPSV
jgi:hypothetical protein